MQKNGNTSLLVYIYANDEVIVASDKREVEYVVRKLREGYRLLSLDINTPQTK